MMDLCVLGYHPPALLYSCKQASLFSEHQTFSLLVLPTWSSLNTIVSNLVQNPEMQLQIKKIIALNSLHKLCQKADKSYITYNCNIILIKPCFIYNHCWHNNWKQWSNCWHPKQLFPPFPLHHSFHEHIDKRTFVVSINSCHSFWLHLPSWSSKAWVRRIIMSHLTTTMHLQLHRNRAEDLKTRKCSQFV